MPDLLDRIRDEIRQRLDASREAVDEYQRLEAALAAHGDTASAGSVRGRRRAGGGSVKREGAAREGRRSSTRTRARRGANREAVLRFVGERPGISAAELAAASGVEKRTLSTLLSALVKQERLERVALPGGQTGYRICEQGVSDSGSASGSTGPVATGGDTSTDA